MRISVCIPIHNMDHADFFLRRIMESLEKQTFRDFEIVITKEGKMAINTNACIQKAKGDIIKLLYMDDYLAHEDSLQVIADEFTGGWLATGCLHDNGTAIGSPHFASNNGIASGINTIGSPSVVAFENKDPLLFDESMSWLLDVDYYKRLGERYGPPKISDDLNVIIGVHGGQMTHILTDEQKLAEQNYLNYKYAK